MTFVATANACLYSNIDFDLVDIDSKTLNIDTNKLKKYFEIKNNHKKTKIIIPVHYGGSPCNMKEIYKIAKDNKSYVIEDASQAMGAFYNKNKIGSCEYSDIAVFSMHPVKTITSGEGGLITTNNKILYNKMKLMRSHGLKRSSKYPWLAEMILFGYNYRITDLQTALANSQLDRISSFLKRRSQISKFYKNRLKGDITFQEIYPESISANHLFIIIFNKVISEKKKINFYNALLKKKIKFAVQYLPVHKHKFYKKKLNSKFLNSEYLYKKSINLPIYPDLTNNDLEYIVKTINKMIIKFKL